MQHINLNKLDRWDVEGVLHSKLADWGVFAKEGTNLCPQGHTLKLSNGTWRCQKKYFANKRYQTCAFKVSMRYGTFFDKSKLPILSICKFVNLWVDNVESRVIQKQVEIAKEACTNWSSYCREVLFDAMILQRVPVGGPGRTVEIDESKFGKRKYHRGHPVEGQWVFGGMELESKRVFMVPVEKRDSQTLLAVIKEWILPGTIIMSDCWKAYDCLTDEGYIHLKVNHSLQFVNSDNGACTNHIEASWNAAKRSINASGRRKELYAGYLAKYMFNKTCRLMKLDPFVEFLRYAGVLYNPLEPPSVQRFGHIEDEGKEEGEEEGVLGFANFSNGIFKSTDIF